MRFLHITYVSSEKTKNSGYKYEDQKLRLKKDGRTNIRMTTKDVSIVDVEAGKGVPGKEDRSSCSSPQESHYSGRKYHWPILLSTGGVLTNGVSIVLSAFSKPTTMYISIGCSIASALLHVIEGIVGCILQPQKALEETVAAAGKAGGDVESQLFVLQAQVKSLRDINAQQESQLQEEHQTAVDLQCAVDAKVTEVARYTQQLEMVNHNLLEARHLSEAWKRATEQVTKQMGGARA